MAGPDQSRPHEAGRSPVSAVTIRQDGRITVVPLKRVAELFEGVGEYNMQFSMGSMMARFVLNVLDPLMAEEGGVRVSPLPSERRQQRVAAANMALEHEPTLAVMGLSLEPVVGKTAVMMAQGEQAGTGELRMHVANRAQFVDFLQAVTPQHLETFPMAEYLATVAKSLSQQLLDTYDLHDPSSEALQLLSGMGAIVGEYKRLGIPVARLEAYYAHVQKKDLREYLLVEHEGLLAEPGKFFGPADWQKDANEEQLRNRWTRALEAVAAMTSNPNAAELRERVVVHLKQCVELALADLPTLSSYDDEERGRLQQVLVQAQVTLVTV